MAVTSTFWGVRGTLPVPGEKSLRFGGNTSCVTLEFDDGRLFVFDAGSGIKELSNRLMARGTGPINAKIFISHPHWDHINSLPYFAPLYVPGNLFEVYGPANGAMGVRELVGAQMDGVFFPITMREFGAEVLFRDLDEEELDFEGITVRMLRLEHPGKCLGFRVSHGSVTICYVTDNELFPSDHPRYDSDYVERLTEFVRGTDALIMDATYTNEEYERRIGWGHSSARRVAELAHRAEVGTLYLFHHDPEQTDDAIDAKLAQARAALERLDSKTRCQAPAEGSRVTL